MTLQQPQSPQIPDPTDTIYPPHHPTRPDNNLSAASGVGHALISTDIVQADVAGPARNGASGAASAQRLGCGRNQIPKDHVAYKVMPGNKALEAALGAYNGPHVRRYALARVVAQVVDQRLADVGAGEVGAVAVDDVAAAAALEAGRARRLDGPGQAPAGIPVAGGVVGRGHAPELESFAGAEDLGVEERVGGGVAAGEGGGLDLSEAAGHEDGEFGELHGVGGTLMLEVEVSNG